MPRAHVEPWLLPTPEPLVPGPRPTFSVIIAAYQAAHTIGAAVESALSRTYPPHVLARAAGRADLTVDERALVESQSGALPAGGAPDERRGAATRRAVRCARWTLLDVALGPSFAPSGRLKPTAFLLPRGAPFLYARKFDVRVDSRVLDLIDDDLLTR
ncbi:MAG: hypothetical protein ABR569_15415 [Gaiellaceae bacterium]